MLNRRILRIKVFKALYSSVFTMDSPNPQNLAATESSFEMSCEAVRDLYILMLGTVSALTQVAADRIGAALAKPVRTEAENNPNTKFANNALALYFREDKEFNKLFHKKFPKFDWLQYDLIFKSMLKDMEGKDWFVRYMSSSETSLAEDCRLFTKIFEEEYVDDQRISDLLVDISLLWNDDLAYALTICCRSLDAIARTGRWTLPPLYQSEILAKEGRQVESDRDFSIRLLRAAYSSYDKYSDMLSSMVTAFEKDRLVSTDVCLMVCCLAEIMTFPNIPARVSINEYVEISKFYGTPKSSVFVNGLLDKAVRRFIADGGCTKRL